MEPSLVFKNYSHLPWWPRFHVKARLKACPWDLILKYFPDGKMLIDVGCGHGLFIHILAEHNKNYESFLGLDLSKEKIEVAKSTADSKMTFLNEDIYKRDIKADVVSILDVLYLIPFAEQELILEYIFNKLPHGGYLVIKEIATRPKWKYCWNYFEEWVMVHLLRKTLGSSFFFRSEENYNSLLKSLGFSTSTYKIDSGYIHSHILYVCKK